MLRSHLEDLSQLRSELNPACHRNSRFFAVAVAKLWTSGAMFHSRYSTSDVCTELLCSGKSPSLAKPAGEGKGLMLLSFPGGRRRFRWRLESGVRSLP
jgi:hypothetical protein